MAGLPQLRVRVPPALPRSGPYGPRSVVPSCRSVLAEAAPEDRLVPEAEAMAVLPGSRRGRWNVKLAAGGSRGVGADDRTATGG